MPTLHRSFRLLRPQLSCFFFVGMVLSVVPVHALPTGPRGFCTTYPTAPACTGQLPSCLQCHVVEPALNAYGVQVSSALYASNYAPDYSDREAWMTEFETYLPQVLPGLEGGDPDGDGVSSLEEIQIGTLPGDGNSVYSPPSTPVGETNPSYDVMAYDIAFAYRRVALNFCGESPSYDEMQALETAVGAAKDLLLHAKLDECVESKHWKMYALYRLADDRIRPISFVGKYGTLKLGDYYADYRLFSYIMTGNRDARDLLLADYHIDYEGNVIDNPADNSDPGASGDANYVAVEQQPTQAPQRAGMITTRWFMVVNTMFSHIPRTTAAQAMRAYLGQDIGRSEGLRPTLGEPTDPDNKGVTEEACARCHSTLDPLAYAFTYYDGINLGSPELSGQFDATRPGVDFETSVAMEIYGTPITDAATRGVRGLAEIAVASDDFKRNLVEMMLKQALQREIAPDENPVLKNLMDSLDGDGYNVNSLLHRMIDTDLFGRP